MTKIVYTLLVGIQIFCNDELNEYSYNQDISNLNLFNLVMKSNLSYQFINYQFYTTRYHHYHLHKYLLCVLFCVQQNPKATKRKMSIR